MGNVQSQDQSLTDYGTQTAPTVGLAIATIAAPKGLYEVHIMARITTGGVNASVADNIQLQLGATVLRRLVHPVVAISSNLFIGEYVSTHRLDGVGALTVNATANDNAGGTVYAVTLYARRVAD